MNEDAKSVMGCIWVFARELAMRGHTRDDVLMWLPDKLWTMLRLEAEDFAPGGIGIGEDIVMSPGHGFNVVVKRCAPTA